MANYYRIRAQRVITRARSMVRREPEGSEAVHADVHAIGSLSAQFSDADILPYVNEAVRDIALRAKASAIYLLIASGTGVGANTASLLRLLPARVFRGSTRARRRDVSSYRRLSRAGMGGSTDHPVYTYSDGRIDIYPTGGQNKYYYVSEPAEVTMAMVRGGTDRLSVDERFEAAVVYYVAAKLWLRMENIPAGSYFTQLYEAEMLPYVTVLAARSPVDTEVEVE